jgi:16S rRNA (guanine527-N7)-methyltransferase
MRSEFISALTVHQDAFGIDLSARQAERLADFYGLVQKHNPILHLVGPCTPEEFAVRHVLESLTLLSNLPPGSRFADVGPGAGFPSVPCLLVRESLHAVLIESKEKKSSFLREVVTKCGLVDRVQVVNRQFSKVPRPDVSVVTCRALDKFAQKLQQLIKWSGDSTLMFYGGPSLREELRRSGRNFKEFLMPLSEQRFLFVVAERPA